MKNLIKYKGLVFLSITVIISVIVSFALKGKDLSGAYKDALNTDGMSPMEKDYLEQKAIKLAKLLGTHPKHKSWGEEDEQAFQLIKSIYFNNTKYFSYFISVYELITEGNFTADLELLDNDHIKKLKEWKLL